MTMSIQSEDIVRQLSVDVAMTLEKHQYFEQLTKELNKQHDVEKKRWPEDIVESLALIASVAWSQQPPDIKAYVEQSSALDNKLSSTVSKNVNQPSATSQSSNISSTCSSALGNSNAASEAFMHRAVENSKIDPRAIPNLLSSAPGSENNTEPFYVSPDQTGTNSKNSAKTESDAPLEKTSRGDHVLESKFTVTRHYENEYAQSEKIRQNVTAAHGKFVISEQGVTLLAPHAQDMVTPQKQGSNLETVYGSKTIFRIDGASSSQPRTNEFRDGVREKDMTLTSDATDSLNLSRTKTLNSTIKPSRDKEDDRNDAALPVPMMAPVPSTPANFPDAIQQQMFAGYSHQQSAKEAYAAQSVQKTRTPEGIRYSLDADKSVQITGSAKKGYVLHASDSEVKRILDKHADATLQVTVADLGDESTTVHSDQLATKAFEPTYNKSEE